jgi:galactose mutarotase-like enzyme
LEDRVLDDAYAGVAPGARFALAGGGRRITVSMGRGFPVAQVYAPADEAVVCFEPMTAPVDALVSGDGLALVPPGRRHVATFSVTVEPDAG